LLGVPELLLDFADVLFHFATDLLTEITLGGSSDLVHFALDLLANTLVHVVISTLSESHDVLLDG